jgi:hypothetical protein
MHSEAASQGGGWWAVARLTISPSPLLSIVSKSSSARSPRASSAAAPLGATFEGRPSARRSVALLERWKPERSSSRETLPSPLVSKPSNIACTAAGE